MSEEVKEAPKKKGKMPVVLALVVLLGAGGFFGMKMKGGAPKKEEVKLGAIEPLGEFLVNLDQGTNIYLRTEISLQLKDGFKKETLEKSLPAVKDAVAQILSSKKLGQVAARNWPQLKHELADSMNHILEEAEAAEHPDKKPAKPEKGEKPEGKDKTPEHTDWDSPSGPVLKIFFTSFATQ